MMNKYEKSKNAKNTFIFVKHFPKWRRKLDHFLPQSFPFYVHVKI